VTNPRTRPTAEEAQTSGWLQEWANNAMESNGGRSLNPNVVKALITFKEYSDMRKLLCEVLSFTLLPNQIEDLRKEFEKFDTEGRGEITLTSLKQVLLHSAGSRSLGSLSEGEVEDIFNAMRIRKTDTTIQWHEFIAAGLSQCDYDDRNLRLAFDRLDSDHKGYISFDDVLDLMGSTGTEESIRAMFQDSLQLCRSKHARLSYDDFLHLMKGQTYEDLSIVKQSPVIHSPVISHRRGTSQVNVEEIFSIGESALSAVDGVTTTSESVPFMPILSSVPGSRLNQLAEDLPFHTSLEVVAEEYSSDQEERLPFGKEATPVQPISSDDKKLKPSAFIGTTTNLLSPSVKETPAVRGRSKSYDEHDSHGNEDEADEVEKLKAEKMKVISDSRRCILLPEHMQDNAMNEEIALKDMLISVNIDSSKSALVANRELYRAHRRMRLAVLEASKRFEENQTLRTKMKLEQANENGAEASAVAKQGVAAGLTMRHGSIVRQDSNIIKELMEKREKEREEQLQQAYKKAGRGKKKRHKTVSDMSAMMALVSQPESSKSANESGGGEGDDAAALANISSNAQTWTGPVSTIGYCLDFR
jgi:Ca2+-binding EF-hand superfamily protein